MNNLNIDLMLNQDAKWLAIQSQRPVNEFLEVASKIDLRQEDWASFWDILGERLTQIIVKEKMEKKHPKVHTVKLNGGTREFNQEEMDFATFLLGQPDLEDSVYNFKFKCDE